MDPVCRCTILFGQAAEGVCLVCHRPTNRPTIDEMRRHIKARNVKNRDTATDGGERREAPRDA